jgi:hypothetical protein
MRIYDLCLYTAVVLALPYVGIMWSLKPGLFHMRPPYLKAGFLGWAFGTHADAINLYRVRAKPTGRAVSIWMARILFLVSAPLMILASWLSTLPMYGSAKFLGFYLN